MYQALLTRRYLIRKVIPQLAMLSVALCTAMVIIVRSVMGGFLENVKNAGRRQVGDVVLDTGINGMAHYDDLILEIEALPEAEAASALIEAFGLLRLPPGGKIEPVRIVGIDPESYDRVTGYAETMFWRPVRDPDEQAELHPDDMRLPQPNPENNGELDFGGIDIEEGHRRLEEQQKLGQTLWDNRGEPGVVVGIEINPYNRRLKFGSYRTMFGLPNEEVTLSVLPLDREGGVIDAESRVFRVYNEFWVGRFDIDSGVVFVPFETLQRMLKMHAMDVEGPPELDEQGRVKLDEFGEIIRTRTVAPPRTTQIIAKAADDVEPAVLRDKVQAIYDRFMQEYPPNEIPQFAVVQTWEQQIAQFIAVVQKETLLVTTLFAIISIVAIFLILAIFWTIVQQKTRDIGILRSVGASRLGIMWLILRYGCALGIVGAILGGILAHIIVWNINPIHEFIGEVTGQLIWDPETYYFSKVPDVVRQPDAWITMGGAVLFAAVGALIPAIRAAYIDPVKALRYE